MPPEAGGEANSNDGTRPTSSLLQRGNLFVQFPPSFDSFLGLPHHFRGFGRIGLAEHSVSQLVVGVVGEGDRGTRRIEDEGVLARADDLRVVADQWPVAAMDGPVLLVETLDHVDS